MLELGPAAVPAHGTDLVRTFVEPKAFLDTTLSSATRSATNNHSAASSAPASATPPAAAAVMDGHAEAMIDEMRKFFMSRKMSALRETFRDQDEDQSGSIDLGEFKKGMRHLRPDLQERDVEKIFRIADADGSGTIEIDEFVNAFRLDRFPREEFFWTKTRPKGLLGRIDRVKLAQELSTGKYHIT
jgi:hypothetical protein